MSGGTAGVPTSLVEITISCRNIIDADVFSKSDPMCVVMYKPFFSKKWAEYKRTECIDNTLNPDFATKISMTYSFEEQQHLKFCLYDIDSPSPNLDDHDYLGEFETTLGQLVSSRVQENRLTYKGNPNANCGTIILTTEELSSCKQEISLRLSGKGFKSQKWFGSVKPFLEFYKVNEDGSYTLVHRTEQVRSSSPMWKDFTVPLRSFCSGDNDRNIKVLAKDFYTNGSHQLLGTFYTTVDQIKRERSIEVMDERKQKPSGVVEINRAAIKNKYTFLDYLAGGCEINAFIGIDFTASNGDPNNPTSLHHINQQNPNQYVKAISAVADIIEDYDSDKYFPVLGFGARLPPDYTNCSHDFFVNGDPESPFVFRTAGVIDAYYKCLNRVQLYGPTNFAPIINHVAKFARNHRRGDKYFILLIITDGIITDMPQTREAIVNASCLPLSIIIVGVGNADFSAMEELDGDQVRLSSRGRYAERDIVQFVPFLDFIKGNKDPNTARLQLAREVLAEVPDQLVSYMKANNVAPMPPKSGTAVPQNSLPI